MSEHEESSDSTQSEADFVRAVSGVIYPFDTSLESLATYINLADVAEIGVTLHVKGAVISGMLISARRFFTLLIGELEQAAETNDGARSFADFYRPMLETLQQDRAEYRNSDKLPPRPHHIHMRHVQTYLDASGAVGQALWRGRLTQVDGWTLGKSQKIPPLPEGVG